VGCEGRQHGGLRKPASNLRPTNKPPEALSANWTDEENDALVADYFAMLADDFAGRPYNKAANNRSLQTRIGRSRGAIEYKHQNVSAVLLGLGLDWLEGYKPALNFQTPLVDAVVGWLNNHPDWFANISIRVALPGFEEAPPLWIGPPPQMRNAPEPEEWARLHEVALQHNVAERDSRNRLLGRAGEETVLAYERKALRGVGRPDLAEAVRWVSDEDGDGAGYDIHSFEPSGRRRLIEVKTTAGWERTPFYLTRNELAVAEASPDEWRLVRVWNFRREPKAFELQPPLLASLALTPTVFEAHLR